MQRLYSGMIRFCSLCQKNTEHYPLHGDGCVAWICSQHKEVCDGNNRPDALLVR